MKILVLSVLILVTSEVALAFDESGSCSGSTTNGVPVVINNFQSVAEPHDYYAHIKIGKSKIATYALRETDLRLEGNATASATGSKASGKGFGKAFLVASKDKKFLSGVIGSDKLSPLTCTY